MRMNNKKSFLVLLLFSLSLLTACLSGRLAMAPENTMPNGNVDRECGEFPFLEQTGTDLRSCIRNNFWPTVTNNYTYSWRSMFSNIDNRGGYVRLVYTGITYSNIFNIPHFTTPGAPSAEHTWPRSRGSEDDGVRESDIHNLFPTLNAVNVARRNYPFAEIDDNLTEKWWKSGTAETSKPLSNVDSYSESAGTLFEPREDHKGNVARAMFYFYTLYEKSIDPLLNLNWFYGQTNDLIRWHKEDQVDDYERQRNSRIKDFQGNDNPFILEPSLVDRIF